MDNSAVQVMLPLRRLLTSRRRLDLPQRRSASVSAVESVVRAIAGARRRQGESNVTKVLAFPLWNWWFRRWFSRRDSVNVARRRR